MLRFLSLAALSLLLASSGFAQTTPSRKPAPKAAAKPMRKPTRSADPLEGRSDGKGLNSYAAPGQPVNDPAMNGKNTPPYDGPAARPAAAKGTTLTTPK